MFQGIMNFASMLKQASSIKGKMSEMQDNLRKIKVQGVAGGGMVTVEASGHQQLLSCRLDPQVFQNGDRELLEDLIVSACNDALQKAKEASAAELGKIMGESQIGDALAKFSGTN